MKIATLVESIRNEVPKGKKAVVFVSGGIDSAVMAVLSKMALEKNKTAFYFIDNGLQRKGEKERVKTVFRKLGIRVNILDASQEFIRKVSNCNSGAKKRDALGALLVEKALTIAKSEGSRYLIFGTIKNDLLVCNEDTEGIVGFHIIEPLKNVTKDGVVELAKQLVLPKDLWIRQHLPGVGFAVRIEGKLDKKKLKLIGDITEIVENKVQTMRLHENLWGYFPFLLSEKVDNKYVVVLRIVESDLGLIAEIPEMNWKQLISLRDEILRSKPEIGRIYLDLTPKPVSLIEFM